MPVSTVGVRPCRAWLGVVDPVGEIEDRGSAAALREHGGPTTSACLGFVM